MPDVRFDGRAPSTPSTNGCCSMSAPSAQVPLLSDVRLARWDLASRKRACRGSSASTASPICDDLDMTTPFAARSPYQSSRRLWREMLPGVRRSSVPANFDASSVQPGEWAATRIRRTSFVAPCRFICMRWGMPMTAGLRHGISGERWQRGDVARCCRASQRLARPRIDALGVSRPCELTGANRRYRESGACRRARPRATSHRC